MLLIARSSRRHMFGLRPKVHLVSKKAGKSLTQTKLTVYIFKPLGKIFKGMSHFCVWQDRNIQRGCRDTISRFLFLFVMQLTLSCENAGYFSFISHMQVDKFSFNLLCLFIFQLGLFQTL